MIADLYLILFYLLAVLMFYINDHPPKPKREQLPIPPTTTKQAEAIPIAPKPALTD